jgi:hypothetical protein
MKFLMAIIALTASVSAFSRDLSCGYGQFPVADGKFPERTDVVRETVVNGEVVLNYKGIDSHKLHYSVATETLTVTSITTVGNNNYTFVSSSHLPYFDVAYIVEKLEGEDRALWCWFDGE